VTPEEIRRRIVEAGCGTVLTRPSDLAMFSADASNYRRVPLAVVQPRTRGEVIAAVAVCRELGVPVTVRGGGTSTSGQAVGSGVVLDTSRHLTRILAVDPDSRQATVEPGVVLDELQRAAAPHGLRFGPDPSTHSRCTLGGMIGNNACGTHSLAWGRTADNVVELEVLTYRGAVLTVGRMTQAEVDEAVAAGGERGELVVALHRLARENLATLRTELGRFPRQVSGYGLEHLLPERGFDLARALVGSEGTCAVILSATVALVPVPGPRTLVVLGFDDAAAAADAVPALLDARGLLALEGFDETLTGAIIRPETLDALATLPKAGAWLFAETEGEPPASLGAAASAAPGFVGAEVVADPARAARLWRIREDGAGLATRGPGGAEAWPGWEDAAVPPAELGRYLRRFQALLVRFGLHGAVFGHFGEGCLHVRIDFDLAHDPATFRTFLHAAADLVAEHGGSLSGEHGDGQARSELLPRLYPPAVIALFERFKALWDPDNGLNAGMIVHPLPVDGNLRVRDALPLVTSLPFGRDDGDFAKAARRCVGVGSCRSTSSRGGVMCPSYRVTREERDSTRGRARVLFEMSQGGVITGGWRSTEVRDALDLCLSCKGCSVDCPVGVDMATYKSEFLHRHYRGRLRPASHYSMGWLPLAAQLGVRAAPLVNAVSGSALVKRLGGIAAERDVPRFARQSFSSWFRRRPVVEGTRGPVLLWVDTFSNAFAPEVLKAGVAVLEDAGYEVRIPRSALCCGLTWVTTGQLGVARRVARRTVRALAAEVEAGTPVVGLEPSCTQALRELPELDPAAGPVASAVRSLAELLVETPGWEPPGLDVRSISQTHCHQHAGSGFGADSAVLVAAGVENTVLDSGCCGLAGNFGFERGHYAVSRAAGEEALLPAVRAAPADTVVLADGFSCRTQIAGSTDRTAVHLAQLLAAGLDSRRTT
jgi:FAD/FMN-containing dehydrogenase/Fe-S oxidoreductase